MRRLAAYRLLTAYDSIALASTTITVRCLIRRARTL